jgi:hypothetical protein
MPAGHGLRARTRDSFSRAFRQKGYIPLSVYLRTYKLGDYVDIKVNSAVQKVSIPGDHREHCSVSFTTKHTCSIQRSCSGCCGSGSGQVLPATH